MASHHLIQSPHLSLKQFRPKLLHSPLTAPGNVACKKIYHVDCVRTNTDVTIARRTAKYQPSIWDQDFLQTLKSDYTMEIYTKRAEILKEEVRRMLNESCGSSTSFKLILIDTIQRLGINYHFKDEINGVLDTIIATNDGHVCERKDDLYTRALRFRLLRQHGYEVSQDIFKSFKEDMMMMRSNDLKTWSARDVKGMLSLYEASFYAFEGEEILDEAQEFTTKHLKDQLIKEKIIGHPKLSKEVSHALELPLHWRVPRVEARWFIDTYRMMMQDMDPSLLLEFAILDFNIVQATYQEDLKYVSLVQK